METVTEVLQDVAQTDLKVFNCICMLASFCFSSLKRNRLPAVLINTSLTTEFTNKNGYI